MKRILCASNPYIRRHITLTEKSLNPQIAHILNQHAGWVQGSATSQKYLHYFSNASSESILEAYGIVPTEKKQSNTLKPKICPNCFESNKPDSKFCASCRMVLTYDTYNETLESQKQKEDKLSALEKQMQSLISALGNMDQSTKNTFAKQLFENGVYKNELPKED